MTAVTGRKRRKRHNARRVGSSTDDDSEHEPIKAGHLGAEEMEEAELPAGDTAPRAEGEEDEEEEEEEEEDEAAQGAGKDEEAGEEAEQEAVEVVRMRPCGKEEEEEVVEEERREVLPQEEESKAEPKGPAWRAPDDARSIVSGYSTLSTLGRSLGSEGRGDDADDEHSELVSETDNESGFASRSLTQERPEKQPASTPQPPPQSAPQSAPRSFLYTHYKPAPAAALSPDDQLAPPTELTLTPDGAERGDGGARSTTPSSSSSASHRLHSRPSFNSHKLIQCDTLARKKLKSEKNKARSLDLAEPAVGASPEGSARVRREAFRAGASVENPRELPSEADSFSPAGPGGRSLAEQVRARLMGSADDLRSVGLRKPLSPETRRKRRAWRRHTVVASPTETCEKRPPLNLREFPLSPLSRLQGAKAPLPLQDADGLEQGVATRPAPTSRFHQYL